MLTVVIPNFNHAKYLPKAINSILDQDYKNLELIIIDDASTDNSVDVIEEFRKKDSRINFIKNEKNKGVIYNLNFGLDIAKGEFIYFGSADDYIYKDFLITGMPILADYDKAGLFFSESYYSRGGDEILGSSKTGISETTSFIDKDDFFLHLKKIKNNFFSPSTNTVIWNTSALKSIGGFSEYLEWHCDLFSVMLIGIMYGVCYSPNNLGFVRYSEDSYNIKGQNDSIKQRKVVYNILLKILSIKSIEAKKRIANSAFIYRFRNDFYSLLFEHPIRLRFFHKLAFFMLINSFFLRIKKKFIF